MPTQFRVIIPTEFQLDRFELVTKIHEQVMDRIKYKDNFPVSIDIVNSIKGKFFFFFFLESD